MLNAKLQQQLTDSIENSKASSRSKHFGRMERNEKIRTYNFETDRVTDNRCKESVTGVENYLTAGSQYFNLYDKVKVRATSLLFTTIDCEKFKKSTDFCRKAKLFLFFVVCVLCLCNFQLNFASLRFLSYPKQDLEFSLLKTVYRKNFDFSFSACFLSGFHGRTKEGRTCDAIDQRSRRQRRVQIAFISRSFNKCSARIYLHFNILKVYFSTVRRFNEL